MTSQQTVASRIAEPDSPGEGARAPLNPVILDDSITLVSRMAAAATVAAAAGMGILTVACFTSLRPFEGPGWAAAAVAGAALSLVADPLLRRCLFCRRR